MNSEQKLEDGTIHVQRRVPIAARVMLGSAGLFLLLVTLPWFPLVDVLQLCTAAACVGAFVFGVGHAVWREMKREGIGGIKGLCLACTGMAIALGILVLAAFRLLALGLYMYPYYV